MFLLKFKEKYFRVSSLAKLLPLSIFVALVLALVVYSFPYLSILAVLADV